MLRSLELENFKAFGKRAHIQFAPITLIFGENSAGKSSILQALNLLKQTRESRETGALLLPRTENGFVDLGSFQEMIFDHDLKRTLTIRIETKTNRHHAIKFSFKRPSLKEEICLEQIEIHDGDSSKCIAKFQPTGESFEPEEFWRKTRFFFNPYFGEPRGVAVSKISTIECVWLTKAKEYWKPEFEWCKENRDELVNRFKEEITDLEEYIKRQKEIEDKNDLERSENSYKKYSEEITSFNTYIEFFSNKFDLEDYISKIHPEEMKTVLGMQGFLPGVIMYGDRSAKGAAIIRQRSDNSFDLGDLVMQTSISLERTLETLFPMGPFRRPPERWYIFTGTSPQDVGYRGDLLPDLLFRRPELVDDANKWLEQLEIGYKLEVKSVGAYSGDLFEMRLIDTRRKKSVNVGLPDVGFGISQLLPFVVQSLASEKQIISIEQPEVHIHPRLQADLGDLLSEAIKEPRENQFIIETHSEHLILRLQRLIYEDKLTPDDVSVIYVSRGVEGAKSQRLRIDEEGDFIDEWPDGFFPERLRELR